MAVTFPSDLEIARKAKLHPMTDIAARMGIGPHLLEPYGTEVAKLKLETIAETTTYLALGRSASSAMVSSLSFATSLP